MKTKRQAEHSPTPAQVISLEAYRRAHGAPAPAPIDPDSVVAAYCRWLALVGAFWAFWW